MLYAKLTRAQVDKFLKDHASDEQTLDVGSEGAPYRNLFPNLTTLDIRPGPEVDVVGDVHALPFKENSFERILCTEVLEHVSEPKVAVAEMQRVLKPGGTILLTTRFMFPSHGLPEDQMRFSRNALATLFGSWENVEIVREARPFMTMAILLQRMAFQVKFRGGQVTKMALLLLAYIVSKLDWLTVAEFNDIQKQEPVPEGVFSSGYYVVAKKPTT